MNHIDMVKFVSVLALKFYGPSLEAIGGALTVFMVTVALCFESIFRKESRWSFSYQKDQKVPLFVTCSSQPALSPLLE